MLQVPGNQDQEEDSVTRVSRKLSGGVDAPDIETTLKRIGDQRAKELQFSLGEGVKIDQGKASRIIRMQLKTQMEPQLVADSIDSLEENEKRGGLTEDWIRSVPPSLGKYIRENQAYASMSDAEIKSLSNLVNMTTMPRGAWALPKAARETSAREIAEEKFTHDEQLRKKFPFHSTLIPPTDSTYKEQLYQQELNDINAVESFIEGKDLIGVLERTKMRVRDNPVHIAPVVSAIVDSFNNGRLQDAVNADKRGEATKTQKRLVSDAARMEYAANRRGHSFMSSVSNVVQESVPFAAELALTSGASAGVRTALQKALFVPFRAESLGVKVLAKGAELATQTALSQAARIPGTYYAEQTDDVVLDDNGNYVILKGTGSSPNIAMAKSLYKAFLSVASEQSGAAMDFLDKPIYNAMFKWWKNKSGNAKATFGMFQKDLRKGGIHGIIGENFEEEIEKIGLILAGEDYKPTSLEELAARTTAFAIPMGAHGAATSIMRPYRLDKDRNAAMSALLTGTELPKSYTENPQHLERIIIEQVKGTPYQFSYVSVPDFEKYAESVKATPEALATEVMDNPAAYQKAKEEGTKIQIPTERALTTLMKDGHGFWQDKIGTNPNEETEEEAAKSIDKLEVERKREDDLQAEIDKKITPEMEEKFKAESVELAGATGDDAETSYKRVVERFRAKAAADITGDPERFYDAAAEQVRDIIKRGLVKAGRSPYESEAQSILAAAFFRTMGIRENIDPVELLAEANVKFAKEGEVTGDRLEASGGRGKYIPKYITGTSAIINFLEKADASTFLHEAGHWWLDLYADLASRSTATEQTKADFQKILDWFGVKDVAAWNALSLEGKRAHHEKWAESFESYLKTGKAPSSFLADAFAKFSAWLTRIYNALAGNLAEPTAQIRAVMDRMLATDREIAEAEAIQGVSPAMSPQALKLEGEEAAAYEKSVERAGQDSRGELVSALTREAFQVQTAARRSELAKVREEVRAQVEAEPIYNMIAALKTNTHADGSQRAEPAIKFDMEALKKELGDKHKLFRLIGMYKKEGGVEPAFVASEWGYPSVADMIHAIENVEGKERKIDRLAVEVMKARYGEDMSQDEIAEHAMKAVNNESLLDLLVIQSRNLAKLSKRKATPIKILAAYAKRVISGMSYVQVNPRLYERAAAKASREAFELAAAQDHDGAFVAKQREILNRLLYKEATNHHKAIEAGQQYADKFNDVSAQKVLGKAGADYLERVLEIMEEYDLRYASNRNVNRRLKLKDWVGAQEAEAAKTGSPSGLIIDSRLMTDAQKRSYKEISLDEFEGVIDAIKNIEHLARIKNSLARKQGQRDFDDLKVDLLSSIIGNYNGKPPTQKYETGLPGDSVSRFLSGIDAFHKKASIQAEIMDGGITGGVLWDTLIRPANDAGNAQAAMHEMAADAFGKLFNAYSASERVAMQYGKQRVEAIDASLTKMARLMVALNWGNAGNRDRVKAGYKWSDAQAEAVLDTLDERDWKFVRGVWDLIEAYWPQIQALHKRVTGIAPEKVETMEVKTKFGVIQGGYFPAKYNSDLSTRVSQNEEDQAVTLKGLGKAVIGSTKHGHREARLSDPPGYPIRLDFGVIFQHVSEVIHDITHYEYIRDAGKILRDSDIQNTIREHYGKNVYNLFRDWLRDIAAGDTKAANVLESSLNWIRQGTSIAGMGWNLSTSAMQLMGVTQSIVEVGPSWIAKGIGKWWNKGMTETVKYVQAKSQMMSHRARTMHREVNEIRNTVTARGATLSWLEESYFYLLQKMQMAVDIPTWLGAYEKAQSEDGARGGETLEEADDRWVAIADQAVLDSQGGGQIKDLAESQRGGPLRKIFSTFYSFFSTTYNQTAKAYARTDLKDAGSVGRLAVDVLLLYTIPATLSFFIKEALRGGLGDEDEESLKKKLLKENLTYIMSTLIGVRELPSALWGYSGWEGPAGLRGFASIGKAYKQLAQGEVDEALLRSLIEAGGVFFHYPAAQINKFISGSKALIEGETSNPVAPLFGPPPKS